VADLGCSPNAAVAYDFLVGKGLLDFQAAAVVGNLQQESGLSPLAIAPAEGAHGIAQWRLDRWQSLLAFAAGASRDPLSFDVQLEFLWHELESIPALGLERLRAARTIEEATVVFQDSFERCGNCATPNRIAFARAALFACPTVTRPTAKRSPGTLAAAAGIVALVAAAGYGVYKVLSNRTPEPPPPLPPFAPGPPPYVIRPYGRYAR
jgi:tail lysozyme